MRAESSPWTNRAQPNQVTSLFLACQADPVDPPLLCPPCRADEPSLTTVACRIRTAIALRLARPRTAQARTVAPSSLRHLANRQAEHARHIPRPGDPSRQALPAGRPGPQRANPSLVTCPLHPCLSAPVRHVLPERNAFAPRPLDMPAQTVPFRPAPTPHATTNRVTPHAFAAHIEPSGRTRPRQPRPCGMPNLSTPVQATCRSKPLCATAIRSDGPFRDNPHDDLSLYATSLPMPCHPR
jgi:hypothetical protein